jgi:poly-gamma-glutamate synthesis protein (capsule biosynthesis protein)
MNKVEITLVGDISPANLFITVGYGIANKFFEHNGHPWIENICMILDSSDIVFGNLESPLLFDEEKSIKTSFFGSYKFSRFLKKCGFNILSVANNHILEQGEKGFFETINILNSVNIKPVGFNKDNNSNLVILEKNNIKLGFAAYNSVNDIKNFNLYSDFNIEKAITSLNKMKSLGVNCKIISLHWGWYEEYINIPSAENIKIARLLVDNGADIVVGHHPHVVQPVERYKGKLIFYSLGNFLFDMIWSKNVRTGMAVKVVYDKTTRKFNYQIIPIYLNKDYTLFFYDRTKFDNRMKKYSNQIRLFDKNKHEYIKKRKFRMKLNQYYQRIMMKIFLIKNWNRLSSVSKRKYIKNVKRKLFKG